MSFEDIDFVNKVLSACDYHLYDLLPREKRPLLGSIDEAKHRLNKMRLELVACRQCAVASCDTPDGLCSLCREQRTSQLGRQANLAARRPEYSGQGDWRMSETDLEQLRRTFE